MKDGNKSKIAGFKPLIKRLFFKQTDFQGFIKNVLHISLHSQTEKINTFRIVKDIK